MIGKFLKKLLEKGPSRLTLVVILLFDKMIFK